MTTLRFPLARLLITLVAATSVAQAQEAQPPVGSSNATIYYNTAFTPSYSGGAGSGNWQFVVSGYTNWSPAPYGPAGTDVPGQGWLTSWTPPAAGNYTFYVIKCGDGSWQTSGAAGPYTLSVSPAPQPAVGSSNATIGQGQSFTPSYYGGAGSGNWQFVVAGYTNWSPSTNGPAGTDVPGQGWRTSWTPPGPGNYTFYVIKCGDSNWQTSGAAGGYTLSVKGYLSVYNGSGSGYYSPGEQANISANSPPSNQVFNVWSQSGPGSLGNASSASTTFTMSSANASVTATYRAVNFNWGSTPSSAASGTSYSVSVNVDSGGFPGVTLYKNGAYFASAWFGTQGSTTDYGTQTVNYLATYYDSVKNSSGSNSRAVSIYIPVYTLSTSVSPAGAGTVSGGGSYQGGSYASVSATANFGYTFAGWAGAAAGSSNPASIYMDGNKSVVANFTSNSPAITSQPSNQTVNQGQNASFSVSASGSAPLSYQWRKDGVNIVGATNSSLTIASAQPTNAGSYSCNVSNGYGSATSNGATLTVVPAAGINLKVHRP